MGITISATIFHEPYHTHRQADHTHRQISLSLTHGVILLPFPAHTIPVRTFARMYAETFTYTCECTPSLNHNDSCSQSCIQHTQSIELVVQISNDWLDWRGRIGAYILPWT